MPIQIQAEIRKTYNGTEYVIQPDGEAFVMNGTRYASATAVVRAIMGADWTSRVVARTFLGLPAYEGERRPRTPRTETIRTSTNDEVVVKVSGKCKHEGCYEPSHCKHGYCHEHCNRHSIGAYADRRYPRTDAPHMGVEIEVMYNNATDFRRGVGIDCHRDGSLGSYGAEYKLLARSDKVVQKASELVEELWKRRARVNRQCGLHVHIDARQVGAERRRVAMDWLGRTEEVWFSLMPPSRRSSSYVARINGGYGGHYTWANYTGYNTLEIRMHGGTLNPHKMAGWLTALCHLQAKMNDAIYTFPSTGDAEADFWALFADCPQAGKEYLATRKANGGIIRDHAYGHIEE